MPPAELHIIPTSDNEDEVNIDEEEQEEEPDTSDTDDETLQGKQPPRAAALPPDALGSSSVNDAAQVQTGVANSDSTRRYPSRSRKMPAHLNDYCINNSSDDDENYLSATISDYSIDFCYNISCIPKTYQQAINSPESDEWVSAMQEEIAAFDRNDTYSLTTLPEGRRCIDGRWVFSLKPGFNNQPIFKARYCAKGFSETRNVDYDETFSPTARVTSIRMLSQIAAEFGMSIHQVDFRNAFLNSEIDRNVYVRQPVGFEKFSSTNEPLVCKLNKSLYGLKQSSRNWNQLLDGFLKSLGFIQSYADPCVYSKVDGDNIIIMLIWVDDIILSSNHDSEISRIKTMLGNRFSMKDLGEIKWFLGIEFHCEKDCVKMSQRDFIHKLLVKFQLVDAAPKSLPCETTSAKMDFPDSPLLDDPRLFREIVGSLIYVSTCCRSDISFVVSKLSQYMNAPRMAHLNAAKNVLKYLKGTINAELVYRKSDKPLILHGFCDSDFAGSEDRRSVTGYCFKLNSESALISWKTKKQSVVALSSCEAEFMSITFAVQEGKFLRQLFADMLQCNRYDFQLFIDNQGALKLSQNPIHHQRSKHIDVKYMYVRQEIASGVVKPIYIPSNRNLSDVFTKPVSKAKLLSFNLNG